MKDKSGRSQHVVLEYRDGQLQQEWVLESSNLVAVSKPKPRSGLKQLLLSAFMPVGWPETVTPDYTGFVAWNTVQAISSYVRGVLSSHAVFKGVGVGSQAATALGAVFQFFVRDILGMAGGILFAFAAGSNFDSNAKQWRLFADIMNDIAMAMDLASPLIPGCFMLLASLGSVARAMVGMSAGATGAALTQHFASSSNAADISAKADSRERATSIVGSLLGMAVTQHLADHLLAAWVFFLVLTWLHVWANIRALRCLVLSSLNQPRLKLLLQHYEQQEKLLTPKQVSGLESLVVPPIAAFLEWCQGHGCGITFGARLTSAVAAAAAAAGDSSSNQQQRGLKLQQLISQQAAAERRHYALLVTGQRHKNVQVVLHTNSSQEVQLQAYLHALYLASLLAKDNKTTQEMLKCSENWVEKSMPQFLKVLQLHGWQLDRVYLPHPVWTAEW